MTLYISSGDTVIMTWSGDIVIVLSSWITRFDEDCILLLFSDVVDIMVMFIATLRFYAKNTVDKCDFSTDPTGQIFVITLVLCFGLYTQW